MADSDGTRSSYEKAQSKVISSGGNVTTDSFNKAWERVYGNKQYKPSWVGFGSPGRLPPPKALNRPPLKKKEVDEKEKKLTTLEEESKRRQRKKSTDDGTSVTLPVQAAPEVLKPRKKEPEVLKINGKELPTEPELEPWKKQIECDEIGPDGRPVYNKIVKETNIPAWMKGNNYWEASAVTSKKTVTKAVKKSDKKKKPAVVNTADYDITVYENKVKRENLKIGERDVPKERELKPWSDGIEIPEKLDGNLEAERDDGHLSEKRKNWNKVLHTANVPGFFSHNNYWD
ncbi:uncharacterized protein [Ptychodera flava]|uniref:uncharacterized protein n=1 Tax=Ptychodera flava TaxID=63121 RepID=UPI00396A146C